MFKVGENIINKLSAIKKDIKLMVKISGKSNRVAHEPSVEEPITLATDITLLTEMAKKSQEIMAEFSSFFKSKTLEKLYTPEYQYNGVLGNTTYIIDRATGQKKLITITGKYKKLKEGRVIEEYTAKTVNKEDLGYKFFDTIKRDKKIDWGYMESMQNERYAGTQIRLTQVEVERAMQIGAESIPLHSLPAALPFHAMMGFKPDKYKEIVTSINDVNKKMEELKKYNDVINSEFFTPIIHHEDGKFYFDLNQTLANAIIRQIKYDSENGIHRQPHKHYNYAETVGMHLSENELEAWKQRALSQPIILRKK